MTEPEDSEEIVVIDGLAQGGDGVARIEGKVVFVSGALPGERVRVRRVEERARFARAETIELLERSPWRREGGCRHEEQDGCGGCGFRHVATEHSLALKTRAALQEMRKIARGVAWPEPALHVCAQPDGARHRVRFQVRSGRLGLFRRGSHQLVPIPECRAAHRNVLVAAGRIEACLSSCPRGDVARLSTVLVERAGEACWAALDGRLGEAARGGLIALVERGDLAGIALRSRGVVERFGQAWVVEPGAVGGRELVFKRRPGSFAQANPHTNQAIRELLHRHLVEAGAGHVMDLFAGSGNLTLVAALSAERVVGVEVSREGLDGLAASARASGLEHIETRRRDLLRGLSQPLKRMSCDAVVLDPPRTGAKAVVSGLLEMGPGRVIYVACSPPHLARDVAAMAEHYQVVSLDAFDMFPRTPHLEMVAALRRSSAV